MTSLFAALNVATGEPSQNATPITVIGMFSCSSPKSTTLFLPKARHIWFSRNSRYDVHFRATAVSWLNRGRTIVRGKSPRVAFGVVVIPVRQLEQAMLACLQQAIG